MALRNAFGNLALDATVQAVYTWLQARLGAKTTANSVSVNIASDQTVPVSAANLPLPNGAATSANQTTTNTSLNSIDGKLPALSSGCVPIKAEALPLPFGAATSANQTTANASLASLDSKAPALITGRVPVDGSGVTQPVSGSVTITGTTPVSAISLPLPTGAATENNQTTANTSLSSIDNKLPALNNGRVPVDVGTSINVGEVEIKNDVGNPVPVSASSLPLPVGAATDVTLTNINAKLPSKEGDSVLITDGGLLAAAKESFSNANSALSGLVLQDDATPDPALPYGPALQVTLRDRVQLDPNVAAVTGGIDPTGAVQRTKVGVDGGTQLTDCKQFVGTTQVVNGTPTGWIDTTGYQSIVVTFFGGSASTVVFQTTNDTAYPSANCAGYLVSGGGAPVSSVINPSNGATYHFPVTGKFFRVVCSGYTSGIIGAVVTLRSAPFAYLALVPQVNIGQVGGTTAQNSSAADNGSRTLGVSGGFRAGSQFYVYNPIYGTYTQTLTSSNVYSTITSVSLNPVTIGGVDSTNASRPLLTDTLGAAAVTSAPSNQAQQSLHELLTQILATLRASAYYQHELIFGSGSTRSASDEPDNLIGDFLHQANQFSNFTN